MEWYFVPQRTMCSHLFILILDPLDPLFHTTDTTVTKMSRSILCANARSVTLAGLTVVCLLFLQFLDKSSWRTTVRELYMNSGREFQEHTNLYFRSYVSSISNVKGLIGRDEQDNINNDDDDDNKQQQQQRR